MAQRNVYLPDKLMAELVARAAAEQRSVSNMLAVLVERGMRTEAK